MNHTGPFGHRQLQVRLLFGRCMPALPRCNLRQLHAYKHQQGRGTPLARMHQRCGTHWRKTHTIKPIHVQPRFGERDRRMRCAGHLPSMHLLQATMLRFDRMLAVPGHAQHEGWNRGSPAMPRRNIAICASLGQCGAILRARQSSGLQFLASAMRRQRTLQ